MCNNIVALAYGGCSSISDFICEVEMTRKVTLTFYPYPENKPEQQGEYIVHCIAPGGFYCDAWFYDGDFYFEWDEDMVFPDIVEWADYPEDKDV